MPETDTASYFLLGSQQAPEPSQGWRRLQSAGLECAPEGLRLAALPVPPVPLKDASGTFGGLQAPTGLVVGPDGTIYVSDAQQHRIYKVVRREGLPVPAHFFFVVEGRFAGDRFVYLPTAHRVERWPVALGRDPQSPGEVEIICETAWDETQARRAVETVLRGTFKTNRPDRESGEKKSCECAGNSSTQDASSIDREEDGFYPKDLPAGEVCKTTITPLPCLGGRGRKPRQFIEPRGLTISPAGDLYVADSKNHRIQVFALRGLGLKAVWGRRASQTHAASPAPGADCLPEEERTTHLGQPIVGRGLGEFNLPWDVVADSQGNIYVADKGNGRVQRFDCHTRDFSAFDGTVLAAHLFLVLYGPERGERFVFLPALHRLERWPRSLGRDPRTLVETVLVNNGVSTAPDAGVLVLKTLGAVGSRDILAEWDRAYPDVLGTDPAFVSPTHLAVDGEDRVYVVDEGSEVVKVLDTNGWVCGKVRFRDEVGGRFQPTSLAIDAQGRLLLGDPKGISQFDLLSKTPEIGRRCSSWDRACTGMAVDLVGDLFAIGTDSESISKVPAPTGFVQSGYLLAGPLDSDLEQCQWHRLVLSYAQDIPLATSLRVWTFAADNEKPLAEIAGLSEGDWQTGQINPEECLVFSPPGRYLWLKLELRGNGTDTPVLRSLQAHFPRITYLQYLPAVYQTDPVGKDFLERFLSLFETVLGGIEHRIDTLVELFDPDGAPGGDPKRDFLTWLARWVDMSFESRWSTETRRRLLRHAPELYRRRGTPAGLKLFLRLVLEVDVRILESFQVRRWLFLASKSALGERSQLWGNCIVNRLQLEENSRLGDFALVGTGDPVRDPFIVHAHKFSVFVPAARLRNEATERMLRHLIDTEKPAHTQFDLVKVEPRFRVGTQSTVGLDTQVGAYPLLVLNRCATLGYDTLLGCEAVRIPGWRRKTRRAEQAQWQSCGTPGCGQLRKKNASVPAHSSLEPPCGVRTSRHVTIAPRTLQIGERSRVGISSVVG